MTLCLTTALTCFLSFGTEPEAVKFTVVDNEVRIAVRDKPFATYVLNDATIRRPFLAHVRSPGGALVTRNHPPIEGQDATDHATMHPGIWLAFGDLSGADFWRNQAAVKHAGFIDKPDARTGSFAVRNRYEADGKLVCEEVCRLSVRVRPAGYLLTLDSTFTSPEDHGVVFGDQEEMGLGVRVATAMAVKDGGQIVSSAGLKNENQVWGKQADWCAYTGTVNGKQVGVLLMPHPDNFGKSWFHARDYGLLVANPFGKRAFTRGEPSRVVVGKGESLRLRFGVLIFDGDVDMAAAYADYVRSGGARNLP